MIKKIEKIPQTILGLEFSGEITAEEYRSVVFPEVETLAQSNPGLKILCFVKKGIHFSPGALIDDALVGLKHFNHWKKVAIVSDLDWLRPASMAMSFFIPGQLHFFPEKDMPSAIIWLEDDTTSGDISLSAIMPTAAI
ncbi:MAG: STAS/SEC14 domain-containing protein [Bacteroidia bacterium]|nr:STAS/SEC14 domain-containing protein [Bacteroidia bacterium]